MKKFLIVLLIVIVGVISFSSLVFCADKTEQYIPDSQVAETGMTLWQIIRSGGEVMVVIAFLSIAAIALVIYYFLSISQEKLLPESFLNKTVMLIESGKYEEVKILCQGSGNNLIKDIVLAGIAKKDHDKAIIEETMTDNGRRSVSAIWQKLSYLADIAAISPMVGLLGTVLGMIQAFNVIAFQTGAVKPILLASGISKAMVTTAAGLIVAIPAMIFYSYFKGVVQSISAQFEHITAEMYQLIASTKRK